MSDHDGYTRRDARNDLDCIECGRWFPTFDRLAKHMYAKHGPPTPKNQTHDAWAKHSGVATVPELVVPGPAHSARVQRRKDIQIMAKKKTRPATGRLPEPSAKEGQADFNEFLKATAIGREGDTGTLDFTGNVRGPEDGEFGERIVAEVRLGRKTYDFSIKTDSGNYRILFQKFGANTSRWKGKVPVTVKHFANNDYVAVVRQK